MITIDSRKYPKISAATDLLRSGLEKHFPEVKRIKVSVENDGTNMLSIFTDHKEQIILNHVFEGIEFYHLLRFIGGYMVGNANKIRKKRTGAKSFQVLNEVIDLILREKCVYCGAGMPYETGSPRLCYICVNLNLPHSERWRRQTNA